MIKKVVITGGHLTPALSLIEEIKNDNTKWQIHYLGRKYALENQKSLSFEFRLLSKKPEIIFHPLTTGRLQRKLSLTSLISLLKTPFGFLQSLILLIKIKPDLVVSFGGYLSVPVILTAWLLRIPSYTHEQTSTLGLANKINSFLVKKTALSFPEVEKAVLNKRTILTGNLISSEVFKGEPPRQSKLYKKVKTANKSILLFTGGKTGSKTINQTVVNCLDKLKKNFFVIHQIGLDQSIEEQDKDNYWAVRFIPYKYMGWLLRQAKLVICRAGANTILELASLKKPAVVIPIPWTSQNEQYKNAQFLADLGLAKIIEQDKLSPQKLITTINNFDVQKSKVCYPEWWDKADPKLAANRFWSIIKSENDF